MRRRGERGAEGFDTFTFVLALANHVPKSHLVSMIITKRFCRLLLEKLKLTRAQPVFPNADFHFLFRVQIPWISQHVEHAC